jgi:hypothetical protein
MDNVISAEQSHLGEFYDHADQLLDNLADVRDIFDEYLAIKLYNWRYKWFVDHFQYDDWDIENDEFSIESFTFNVLPFNLCMNWSHILTEYFGSVRPIILESNKDQSKECRTVLENGGLVAFYFRCNIPFPQQFLQLINNNMCGTIEGENILRNNLTPEQLFDFENDQKDYLYSYD